MGRLTRNGLKVKFRDAELLYKKLGHSCVLKTIIQDNYKNDLSREFTAMWLNQILILLGMGADILYPLLMTLSICFFLLY